MDLQNILNQINKTDPEFYEKISPRRHVLSNFTTKVAAAALPFAIGSLFNKAYGKSLDVIADTLNYALTLEYLEYNFYQQAINSTSTLSIPASDLAAFKIILAHEQEHVTFLASALTSMAGATVYRPTGYTGSDYVPTAYDFTLGGTLNTFGDYPTFLVLSQTFEDTGVRAYKGAAPSLQTNLDILTYALQIHSVEARHASRVRLIRHVMGTSDMPKPWITEETPPASIVAANYNGENNVIQDGITITTLTNDATGATITMDTASEAFDEPLDMATVVGLVTPFFKS